VDGICPPPSPSEVLDGDGVGVGDGVEPGAGIVTDTLEAGVVVGLGEEAASTVTLCTADRRPPAATTR
jgi:hypothetical protein